MYSRLKLISALNIKILCWHWHYKINDTSSENLIFDSLYLLISPTIVLSQTWIEQPLSLLYCASCVRDTAALRAQPTCRIMKWNSKPNRALQSTIYNLHTLMAPSSQEFHVEYQQWRFCLSNIIRRSLTQVWDFSHVCSKFECNNFYKFVLVLIVFWYLA